jgi:hypothetical protein
VLLGVVHHVDVVLVGPLVHEPLGLVRSELSLELLLGRFRLVMASIVSFYALLGPQAVRQVRHEPQEIGALNAFVKYLVTHVALIRDACHKSGVLYFHRNLSDWLLANLSPGVAGSLLVKVEPSLIKENDLTFSSIFCSMVGQEPLQKLYSLQLI